MKFNFGYTGIRVRDIDKAIYFFTKLLGMKVQARIPAPWNKGEFVNLVSGDGKHWLEINWYADDGPVAEPFSIGEQLDHLGFEVDDFEGSLKRLNDAGYPTLIGPRKAGKWEFAFVKGVDDIWLDIYRITHKLKKRTIKKAKKRT
jgi:catechol 2,3-dioxygenase-like lactoylglutathione lyase family enzyme